jgi:hypothetical protein
MIFIIIAAIVALALATVSEAFSIIGMAQTFPFIFWSVIAMGVVLGAGKLVGASFVYRYWKTAPKALTIPIAVLVCVLTVTTITSHFGYLSNGYLHDSLPLKQVTVQIEQFEKERDRKIVRKQEIDTQIAQLPSDRAASRVKLAKQFADEQNSLTARINSLDTQITELKGKQLDATSHVGPIAYISSAIGITTDDGVKWFILLIAGVFDPLALLITIAISHMVEVRKLELEEANKEEDAEEIEQPKKRIKKPQPPSNDLFELTKDVEAPKVVEAPKEVFVPITESNRKETPPTPPASNTRGMKVTTPYSIR